MLSFCKLQRCAGALSLMLVPAFVSCTESRLAEDDVGEKIREPTADLRKPTLAEHMGSHFTYGTKVRDSVINGDLSALRRYARWIAEHKSPDELSTKWRKYVQAMQDAAQRAHDADDLASAAHRVAELAASCGGCHSILGGPETKLTDPPAMGPTTTANMMRHQWAAKTMWEALTMPSDEAWQRAVGVMLDAPLVPENLANSQSIARAPNAARDVERWSREVHEISKQARDDRRMRERVRAYGQLLNTCASCHNAVRLDDATNEMRMK